MHQVSLYKPKVNLFPCLVTLWTGHLRCFDEPSSDLRRIGDILEERNVDIAVLRRKGWISVCLHCEDGIRSLESLLVNP